MKKLALIFIFFILFYFDSAAQTQISKGNSLNFSPGKELMGRSVLIAYLSGNKKITKCFLSFSSKANYQEKALDRGISVIYAMERYNYIYFKKTMANAAITLKRGKCYGLKEVSPDKWVIEEILCRDN